MAQAGDNYTIVLKETHLNWGTHRYTYTRDRIAGEAYIPIPARVAYDLNITRGSIFNCTSSDRSFNHQLKATGSQHRRDFAKNFHGNGDLKVLGNWLYEVCNVNIGDSIRLDWTSPTDIVLTHIPSI